MRYFSTFSGVEGIGKGLPEDWECVGFSEIDKYASQVLRYRFPNIKNYGDISKINWREVPDFDLLTGGSPCQDFSIAGKRRGLAGSRSSLAWEYIRALRDKQPRYFLWENVKGVMSSRKGWDFANLLVAFSESGYSLWWQVLNAKDFGVPQNRERIFVFGSRNGSPREVFFERENREAVDELPGQNANNLTTRYEALGTGTYVVEDKLHAQGTKINVLYKNKTGKVKQGYSQTGSVFGVDGIAPQLDTACGRYFKVPSATKCGYEIASDGDGLRLSHIGSKTGRGRVGKQRAQALTTQGDAHLFLNGRIRKLMPIECERLMSWPDNHTQFGIDDKGNKVGISDSQRYKMCGNGVVSAVVKEIIKAHLTP